MEHCPRMIQRIFDMNIKKHFLLLLCGWLLFHSCITLDIRRDWDTSSDRKKASQYTDHIPVTAQEIKECLIKDTAYYKIVLIYGLACPNCSDMFKKYYSGRWFETDTSNIRWYFVQNSCSGLDKTKLFLANHGITGVAMYYLRDDNPLFVSSRKNESQFDNLTRYITGNSVVSVGGIPFCFIVNKHGSVKMKYQETPNGTFYLTPMQVEDITLPITELDFKTVDTIRWNGNKLMQCTPHSCN